LTHSSYCNMGVCLCVITAQLITSSLIQVTSTWVCVYVFVVDMHNL
jgi:hypothetical protein